MQDVRWIVSACHPAEAETATGLHLLWELRAFVREHSTVLLSPDGRNCLPFGRAGVEETEAASRDGNIKLGVDNITPSVGGLVSHLSLYQYIISRHAYLHDHLLPAGCSVCKCELVARATRCTAGADSGKTVGQVVVDSPWRLVAAHIGRAAYTSGWRVDVCVRTVRDIAGFHGCSDPGSRPGA